MPRYTRWQGTQGRSQQPEVSLRRESQEGRGTPAGRLHDNQGTISVVPRPLKLFVKTFKRCCGCPKRTGEWRGHSTAGLGTATRCVGGTEQPPPRVQLEQRAMTPVGADSSPTWPAIAHLSRVRSASSIVSCARSVSRNSSQRPFEGHIFAGTRLLSSSSCHVPPLRGQIAFASSCGRASCLSWPPSPSQRPRLPRCTVVRVGSPQRHGPVSVLCETCG